MKYHIDWHHPSGQVQALPRPQVCHVGLQTSEALQVGGSFQTVTSLNALNNHSNNLPFLSFTFTTPVSRHSFLAQYDIYNVATGRSASWNLEGKDSIPSHGFSQKRNLNEEEILLLVCRRIKLQPDLDELIKQLGGPAPPPLPRGQVIRL